MRKFIVFLFLLIFPCLPQQISWVKAVPSDVAGGPAVFGDRIVVLTRAGRLMCLDSRGKVIWEEKVEGGAVAAPSMDREGNIYAASLSGCLYSFTLSGRLRWKRCFDAAARATPIVKKGKIVLALDDGRVFLLSTEGKKLRWFRVGQPVFSSPAFDLNMIVLPTKDFYVYGLDFKGKVLWKFRTAGVNFSSPAIAEKGNILITTMGHCVYKLSPDGRLLWLFRARRWIISSPVVDDEGNVYFGSYDKTFYSLSSSGKLRWKIRGEAPFNSIPVIDRKGRIYVGNTLGYLYCISKEGRLLWKNKVQSAVKTALSILPLPPYLLFSSCDGKFYAIALSAGLSERALWPKFLGNLRNSGWRP